MGILEELGNGTVRMFEYPPPYANVKEPVIEEQDVYRTNIPYIATLRAYRQFYQIFPNLQIQQTLLAESWDMGNELISKAQLLPLQLSWMHYERLMCVKDAQVREWYMREASQEQWDYLPNQN